MSKYFFYAIKSQKDSSVYKGITGNPYKRLKEHNLGKTRSTRSRIPYKMIYIEECSNRLDAREKEKFYKTGVGREKLKSIINN